MTRRPSPDANHSYVAWRAVRGGGGGAARNSIRRMHSISRRIVRCLPPSPSLSLSADLKGVRFNDGRFSEQQCSSGFVAKFAAAAADIHLTRRRRCHGVSAGRNQAGRLTANQLSLPLCSQREATPPLMALCQREGTRAVGESGLGIHESRAFAVSLTRAST